MVRAGALKDRCAGLKEFWVLFQPVRQETVAPQCFRSAWRFRPNSQTIPTPRVAKTDRSKPSPELQSALDQSLEKREDMVDLLEIADLFNQISALGEAERKACIQILNVFAEYRKTDTSPFRFR